MVPAVSVEAVVARLRAAGCVFAEDEAALLVEAAPAGPEREALVARRVAGEPLEQVLGWVAFAGLRVLVGPGVFVPRRRTELLVRLAAELAPPHPVVVELCCGVGAVAAALQARVHPTELHPTEMHPTEMHVADVDPVATAWAARNVPDAQVHTGDLYGALPSELWGRVDVLCVNAPYVPTAEIAHLPPEARDHEPHHTLDGGPDGLQVHRRVAAGAPRWLVPGGYVLLETSEPQARGTAAALAAAGLAPRVVHDAELGAIVVVARAV